MRELSDEQRKAAEHIDGPCLCIAGPGAGKTFTLVRRVDNLVKHGIDPQSILIVTFTVKAAAEMRERYMSLPNAVEGPVFRTIHAFALNVLQNERGYNVKDIISPYDQTNCIRESLRKHDQYYGKAKGRDSKTAANVIADIGRYRCEEDPDQFIPSCFDNMHDFLVVYNDYKRYKNESGKFDFDDILDDCRKLFIEDENALERWRNIFRYIMVDEFQDTSKVQSDILYMLAKPKNNIFVVGDDDQSIYGFRGARPDIFLHFKESFPDAEVVKLTTNYRSKKDVVTSAGSLIKNNQNRFEKNIISNDKEPGNVSCFWCDDSNEQDDLIAFILNRKISENEDLSNTAILTRTNMEAGSIAFHLSQKNIPFQSTSQLMTLHSSWLFMVVQSYMKIAMDRYDEKDIRTALTYPTCYVKRTDMDAVKGDYRKLKRLPGYIGRNVRERFDFLKYLKEWNEDAHESLDEFLEIMDEEFGFDKMIHDHCRYTKEDEDEYDAYLDDLIDECHMFSDIREYLKKIEEDENDFGNKQNKNSHNNFGDENGVVISTIHKAKGLEWDDVIIPSCNYGNMPYVSRRSGSSTDFEEERRLFYVAFTRAKNSCIVITVIEDDDEGRRVRRRGVSYITEAGIAEKMQNADEYMHPGKEKTVRSENNKKKDIAANRN